jgi:HAE1 family hydrophobic/amphiphilic exporter-1
MGGGAGEWFRPFAVTVVASVLVSLFISFTLDPMLSALLGRPAGHSQRERKGIEKYFAVFNTWFDHQANRYGNVIAWCLHHRKIMAVCAWALLFGALFYQFGGFGRSEFLPKSDYGTLAVDVRTPSSTSLEYARNKVEKAAELARSMPETKSTDARVNATGGRVWIDVGDKGDRSRSLEELATDMREKLKQLVGAEYTVFDDLGQGARKPVQIQFYGSDSRKLMELTNQFMEKVREIPGAVDVGPLGAGSQGRVAHRARSWTCQPARHLGQRRGPDAARGVRRRGSGDWVDPIGESRDVAVRLSPEDRVSAENIEHLPIAVTGTDMMVPLEQIATISMGKGPARINHLNGKRTVTVAANVQGVDAGTVSQKAKAIADAMTFPPGFGVGSVAPRATSRSCSPRWASRWSWAFRHVPGAGDAVRFVHRADRHHAVTAAVADRRGAGDGPDARLAESHELHRRHHADGPGGQERHPAARLHARRGKARRGS